MSSLAPIRPSPPLAWLLNRLQLGRHKGWLIAGALLIGAGPPIYLLQTGNALSTGYTIQQLQKERSQWIVKNEQLGAEIARARSLAWIESEAVTRLGMQRPAQQTVVKVDVPPPSFRPENAAATVRARQESAAPTSSTQGDAGASDTWSDALGSVLANLLVGR